MLAYLFRRLLLVPVTMLGVTFLVFFVSRLVPGGPVAQAMQAAMSSGNEEQQSDRSKEEGGGGLNDDSAEALEEQYGYDKSVGVAYLQWLGVWEREVDLSKSEFSAKRLDQVGSSQIQDSENETLIVLKGVGTQAKVVREGNQVLSATMLESGKSLGEQGWTVRIESPQERQKRWAKRTQLSVEKAPQNYSYRAVAYRPKFRGLIQGDLGESHRFGDSVWSMIRQRIPVALYFGLLTAVITYLVCLPLGVMKAIKHRTALDNVTSILIFIGYSIPGFALGAILLVYLGARMDLFPLFGMTSSEFDGFTPWEKVKDIAHHTVLPLSAYLVGAFASTTMMMKNNLMDHLSADYVRTAVAKGVSFPNAVWKHAFRNSFIPIATGLGGLITIIISGSMLIEKVFDIQGFGLLQYQAILDVDVPVIMGTLTISAFLMLLGNILSDVIVAMVDPRVKFK